MDTYLSIAGTASFAVLLPGIVHTLMQVRHQRARVLLTATVAGPKSRLVGAPWLVVTPDALLLALDHVCVLPDAGPDPQHAPPDGRRGPGQQVLPGHGQRGAA